MYLRAIHAELEAPALRSFVRENTLGLLITAIRSPTSSFPTIQCTHMPWVLDDAANHDEKETGLGKLRGHLARANPHSKAMIEALQGSNGALEHEVSVVFTAPAHNYVPPRFYTETKPATGKVVPTWNYSAVQAYGKAVIFHDVARPETGTYLQSQVEDLTRHSEEVLLGHGTGEKRAWQVSDAPAPFIEILKRSIIGIEIEIHRLEGKHKMSQEMSQGDRRGVVEGFEALGTEHAREMAKMVQERGAKKDAEKAAALTTDAASD